MHGTIDCMLCSVRPAVRPELEFVTYARKVRLNWSKFFSLPSQEIGWEDRLRNDLFCVEWDVEPCSIHPSF